MTIKGIYIFTLVVLSACIAEPAERAPETPDPNVAKGALFIIGGGARPDAMMQEMMRLADLNGTDYGLVFTQTSSEPDTSYYYLTKQLRQFTEHPLVMVNDSVFRPSLVDSIRGASLIFITGGDQARFLNKVPGAAQGAIAEAYQNGALIGGTSAGAALMSELMITGDQNLEAEYEPTYSWLRYGNGVYTKGLGLIDNVIIDQHFVARSRFNRIISALADTEYPYGVGIDESTALVVCADYCTVAGENQVMVFHRPEKLTERDNRIGLRNLRIDAYLQGDTFSLAPSEH
jgi:cyanophycinase